MTTFTTEDRKLAEFEPVPFFGWIDKEDTEAMLRQQLQVMQAEIQRLRKKLMDNGIRD